MQLKQQDHQDILSYWFGEIDDSGFAHHNKVKMWFMGGISFDADITTKYGELVAEALAGGLREWEAAPLSRLALIILLDQFTRNVYRGSSQAFAGDARACALAQDAIAKGWDEELNHSYCAFLYMPLEHSEDIARQELSVTMFSKRAESMSAENKLRFESFANSALVHRDIIQQFGRFPHRNEVLGREFTAAEVDYLQHGGQRFGQ